MGQPLFTFGCPLKKNKKKKKKKGVATFLSKHETATERKISFNCQSTFSNNALSIFGRIIFVLPEILGK